MTTPAVVYAVNPRLAPRTAARVLIVISLGMLAGAADSWIRPVKLAASVPAAPTPAGSATTPAIPSGVPGSAAPAEAAAGSSTQPVPGMTTAVEPAPALGLHITLAQARKLFEGGTPFLDARTKEEYAASHIAGSFHLPSDAFDQPGGAEALKYLDQDAPVVIYCGGGDCHASEYVAIRLEQAGFKAYHIMTDGFPAWKDAGYEVAAGDQ